MADRKGFEPPVRFCNAKSRCVRKLQKANVPERILLAPGPDFVQGPVSIRLRFVLCRRRRAIRELKLVTRLHPDQPKCSILTASLPESHERTLFSPSALLEGRQGFCNRIFRRLPLCIANAPYDLCSAIRDC